MIRCAPVLITTVNRYHHFRNCLESLSRCGLAEKTDVYVAVDYPPSKKYWEGYNKIKEYLDTCGTLGFLSLNITYRERNYFYSRGGNMRPLRDEVLKKYDTVICTEDDNIFSPNFLVYMNKGLEKFKNDKTVLAINGYCHIFPLKYYKNNFMRHDVFFSVWGFGIWKDRIELLDEKCNVSHFRKVFFHPHKMARLLMSSPTNLISFFKSILRTGGLTDSILSVFMVVENKCVIMPIVSKVRNCGFDKSGEHSLNDEVSRMLSLQKIDDNTDFEYEGDGFECFKENHRIMIDRELDKPTLKKCYLKIKKELFKNTSGI